MGRALLLGCDYDSILAKGLYMDWPTLLRTARRMVNLTQEDFGADLGRSQSLIALWESGKRQIPAVVRRRVLDIIAGYYPRQPEYKTLASLAVTSPHPVALYRQELIAHFANPFLESAWHENNVDLLGDSLFKIYGTNARIFEISEMYVLPMLRGKSDIIAVSYNDRSLMKPNLLVRRTATVYRVGEGRLLFAEDQILGENDRESLPAMELQVLTADDA
ncbi:helix-turn-helix domain-containing protein [Azospirillum sp. sgz302134]